MVRDDAAIVILAGGKGERLGSYLKPLLPWGNGTLLSHAIHTASESQAGHIRVVLGHAADALSMAVPRNTAKVVINPNWPLGMSSSLKAGLESLPTQVDVVIFTLVDQPLVTADTLDGLLAIQRASGKLLAMPRFDGHPGPPALISRPLWPAVMALQGDTGARSLFRERQGDVAWLEVAGDISADIDTLDDYHRLGGGPLTSR